MAKYTSEFSGPEIDRRLAAVDNKAGCFYYDATKNRYLVFADETARDMYLADTTSVDLIIGAFDAPFNYSAKIVLESQTYNAVALGTTGLYIDFLFDVENKNGMSTGESVVCTYTFRKGSITHSVTEQYAAGRNVHFNIDKYLTEGTNNITISIQGMTTLAATTVAVIYQVVSLSLTDEFDITKVYDLLTGDNTLAIPYTLSGQGTKTMEWYIDGEQVTPNISEDEATDTTVSKIKYITLSALSTGVHNVQIRAYTLVGGEKFYTDTLYREIMVVNEPFYTETLFAVKAIVPKEYGIIGPDSTFMLYGAEQYLPYNVKFATNKSGDVAIKFGASSSELTTLSTIEVVQGVLSDFSITPKTSGLHVIRLATADFSREINILISETSLDLKEITDALEFSFTARGRSNSAVDKDVWEGHNHTATFEGFKWNNQSGWVENALLIGEGASVSFDYAPLATNSVNTGKTIELEFATRNVDNENTVICDLRNADGTGLLLTASEARLVSKVGSVVYTKFKSDDRNRITFVINRNANVVNKNLVFIYINGILSGAINYGSADNYLSDTLLSLNGTAEAQIALYDIFVYNTALSSSQILNNYILYRTTIEDMRGIYEKNDILEEGKISVDKTRRNIPVMIVTGDLLDLDEKSDTDYYITADIDYYNDPDPTKNFRIEGARIRIQGTSSRFYPRKNYRFYTNKADYTVLYDANGNVVADGLYAFKDGAQPVDCWCLKADFAESSGSHNTGVARIWNEVMTNASFSHTNNAGVEVSGYPLRTQAQTIAKSIGFGKDVRTTIDGFPILLFRRDTKNDEPIFVGKYNFNNDKSTPSVFGFTDIPDFDDSKVQSWECLENEDPIALFKTVDGFFDDAVDAEGKSTKRWELAFEARHEGASASVNDLYGFCSWVVSKNGKTEEFATEKWEHMDVYKVAAYYVYLMRFGALDQVVKNCFLTSEDGVHFYFINYDNDTILGVDNTGEISAMPDVTRQTQYANGSYVYAGHESVLWNMLEADSEFMAIVRIVDSALYSAGLTYKAVLDMFNNKQSGQWVERVYNEDAQYKYIAPYTDKGINYLSSLQGSRKSHRTWWLSKRFSLYDSLFASGDFTAKAVEMKCLSGTPAGHAISIVSGIDMNYGYGLNRVPREIGVHVPIGESHTFIVDSELGIGTPVAIYAAPYLRSLDLSDFAPYINTFNVSNVYDATLGSRLRKLVVGKTGVENHDLNAISGINMATRLQELDIRGLKGITSLDLSNQTELVSLEATGSGLASITFAKGAPITTLKLPASVLALNLEQLPKLSTSGLSLENLQGIESMTIKGCPLLSKDISFVTSWIDAAGEDVSLYMDNIEWKGVNYEDLIRIGSLSKVTLRGYAKITESSQEIIDSLSAVFGTSVFDKNSDFCIDAPDSIFISGPDSIYQGESAKFSVALFPQDTPGVLDVSVESLPTGAIFDKDTLVLSTKETSIYSSTVTITAYFLPDEGIATSLKKIVTIKPRVYPSIYSIVGPSTITGSNSIYTANVNTDSVNGEFVLQWEISGDIANYIEIKKAEGYSCSIDITQTVSEIAEGYLRATVIRSFNNSAGSSHQISLQLIDDSIAETDEGICKAVYAAGLCQSNKRITKEEARNITQEQFNTIKFSNQKSYIKSFDGFKWFRGIIELPFKAFLECNNLVSVTLPEGITSIGVNSFYRCSSLSSINLPEGLQTISHAAFTHCGALQELNLPQSLISIGYEAFKNTGITKLHIPKNVTEFSWLSDSPYTSATSGCSNLSEITVDPQNKVYSDEGCNVVLYTRSDGKKIVLSGCKNSTLHSGWHIGHEAFAGVNLKTIDLSGILSLGVGAFKNSSLESVYIPKTLSLSSDAFLDCSNLTEVTFEDGRNNDSLPSKLLAGTAVKSLRIPEGMTSFATEGLPEVLEHLFISSTVNNLLNTINTGGSLPNLKTITVDPANTTYDSRGNCLCRTGSNTLELFSANSIIPQDIIGISSCAAKGLKFSNTHIELHQNIKNIDSYAFYGSNITSIRLLGVSTIGTRCFMYCADLVTVEFGPDVDIREIPQYCFYECSNLVEINIPNSVETLGDNAFYRSKITTFYGPTELSSIGQFCFSYCKNLTTVDLSGTKITNVSYFMLSECDSLQSVRLPSTVQTIGGNAFYYCGSLKDLYIFATTAPVASANTFGSSDKYYTGVNEPNSVLYVPANSTGYDESYWLDPLQNPDKCGFTISYTL